MPDDLDVLDQKIAKIVAETVKTALIPITEKLDALKPKEEEPETPEETDKLDAFQIADATLRTKLDGLIPADKLKAMKTMEMAATLGRIQASLSSAQGGHMNPIPSGDKLDALKEDDPDEIIWE